MLDRAPVAVVVGLAGDQDADHDAGGVANVAICILGLAGGEDATPAVAAKGVEVGDAPRSSCRRTCGRPEGCPIIINPAPVGI